MRNRSQKTAETLLVEPTKNAEQRKCETLLLEPTKNKKKVASSKANLCAT